MCLLAATVNLECSPGASNVVRTFEGVLVRIPADKRHYTGGPR